MAVTGLTGSLNDDHILAAVGLAEFGDAAALDPTAFQVEALLVKTVGTERVFEYNIKTKP